MSKKLSIVIPICNTDYPPAHYTGNAIGCIKEYTTTPYEIIIVDNASSVELSSKEAPLKTVVDKYYRFDENMGVPKAWNKGIELSEGDYICIMNSDVEVYEHWDTDMIESLEDVALVMAYPMYAYPYGRTVKARELRNEWKDKTKDQYLNEFADFSCFMVKKEIFDVVGLFDEEYGLGYGEDVDFRIRMEEKGLVARSDKRVNTHHIGMATGHTIMSQGVKLNEQMEKNTKYTKDKWDLDEYNVPGFRRNK